MARFNERLHEVESYIAESRDDNDPIRLSEITERIQEVIHEVESMNVKLHSLENQAKATRRLTIAIGAAVAATLAELLYYVN